ncbi:MAG: aspartyl protease family protein [Prevotellaceae bacterium]|jgi:predicted aspartyl protease|nr:aspartyl protease family protein [Prevotellaceae bacterium]
MRKGVIVLILFFKFINTCFSQTLTENSFGVRIENGLIYIDSVFVNGVFSKNFVVDTGCELTVLDSDFADRLQLAKAKEKISVIDINGNSSIQRKIVINSLQTGNMPLSSIKGLVIDLSSVNQNIDGIIGANCFRDNIWLFDLPENKIHRILNVNANDYKYKIPFKLKNNVPYINLKIADVVLKNVIIDTGNANRISFDEKDTILLTGKSDSDFYYQSSAQSLFDSKKHVLKIKESFFNSVYLNNMRVDSCHAIFYGKTRAIGIPFFKESAFVMDFVNKILYTDGFHQKTESYFGCRFAINEHGKIIVSSIRENSLAQKKGVLLGDEIVKFNNIELNQLRKIVENGNIYAQLGDRIIVERKNMSEISIISEY